jgi:uncharacterized membrane protein
MPSVTGYIVVYLAGVTVFTVLDIIWIGFIAAPVYQSELGPIIVPGSGMGPRNLVAALLTWMVIVLGILVFALPPAFEKQSAVSALLRGALMGFALYAVYDLTNLAVLRGWTLKVTLFDIAWGTVICGVISVLMFFVSTLFTAKPGS